MLLYFRGQLIHQNVHLELSDKIFIIWKWNFYHSEEIFAVKLASFEEHIGAVRKFYETKHQNWFEIDGSLSKWKLWNVAIEDSKKSIRQIQEYLDRVARGLISLKLPLDGVQELGINQWCGSDLEVAGSNPVGAHSVSLSKTQLLAHSWPRQRWGHGSDDGDLQCGYSNQKNKFLNSISEAFIAETQPIYFLLLE